MIKLLHVITDTNTGGAGVLLLNQLKYFDRERFDIFVALPRGSELVPKIKALGYPTIETKYGADRSFELPAVSEYRAVMSELRPDIVHAHGALSARAAALLNRVPVRIHTRHCTYPQPAVLRHFPGRQLCGAVNGLLSTGIVAVAEAAAGDLASTGTKPEKITVIINGVEPLTKSDEASRRATRASLGFNDNNFIAGIFARLEECKGHRYLLDALALMGRRSRTKVLICGKGSLEPELKRLAESLGVADRVVFAGFCEDITPYMNAVDVNVNCSVGTETSSLALSEGMSVGKPAVVSDYGGNPCMVEDGVSGIVVPARSGRALAEALSRLENDAELTARLGAKAYERYCNKFTAKVMTKQLEKLYINQFQTLK